MTVVNQLVVAISIVLVRKRYAPHFWLPHRFRRLEVLIPILYAIKFHALRVLRVIVGAEAFLFAASRRLRTARTAICRYSSTISATSF